MRARSVTAIAALLLVAVGCGGSADEATLTTVTTTLAATATTAGPSSTTVPSSTVPPATLPSEAAAPTTKSPVPAPPTTRPAPPAPPTSRPAPPTPPTSRPPAPLPSAAALTIKDFAFAPGEVHVARGATVTTTNQDGATHTWTADDGSWTSAPLTQGAKSSHRFDAAGSFTYHCEIHPSMQGRVVVG